MAKYVCSICGFTHEGNEAPEKCPVCMATASFFSEIVELHTHSKTTTMAELKKYVCPNCGETTTNKENCEHCGSLLVRFVAQGIDICNTPYTDDSLIFPVLIEELEKNLRYQAEAKEDVFTEIHWINKKGKEQYLWVNNQSEYDNSFNTIQLDFEVDFSQPTDSNSPNYVIEKETEIIKFAQLKSFQLFTSEVNKDDSFLDRYSYINCGQDAKGAAQILSEILVKVFGISSSDSFEVFTGYDDIDEEYFVWRKEHGYNEGYLSRDDDEDSHVLRESGVTIKSISDENNSQDVNNDVAVSVANEITADEEAILKKYQENPAAILVLVKWYKETYGVGLKEAKDRVDFVLNKHGLRSASNGNSGSGCMVTILIAISSTLSVFFLL